jgi:hypothetical protein
MNNKPRIPDAIDQQKLSYMQLTARMKESADKHGVGFIGGFVTPTIGTLDYTTAVKEAIEDEACANNKHDIIDWILDDIRTNP